MSVSTFSNVWVLKIALSYRLWVEMSIFKISNEDQPKEV